MATALGTHVPVAGVAVAVGDGMLSAVGLGSCVALILHDAVRKVGGMAHVLLPDESQSRDRALPGKFGSTAVPHLLACMEEAGAGRAIVARMAGGASMFAALAGPGTPIGERNAIAVREALQRAGIPLVGEDVGGEHGRSVYFDIARGTVRVVSLRHGERFL